MKISSKDILKGARVQLRNGWYGTMAEKFRGNTPMVTVEGFCTETGSCYATDIVGCLVEGEWMEIEHTPGQIKSAAQRKAMGF